MREIKFRAWDTHHKEWLGAEHRVVLSDGSGVYVWQSELKRYIPYPPVRVMQYTGLEDKNGKEIYEGDIITHSNDGMIGVVTWSNGLYRFVIENLEQTEIIADLCDYDFEPEVLGNIYENPELLK